VIDAGYFPKLIARRPEWLKAAAVVEVCSVSECVSPGPPDWIQHWLHNWLGWFNNVGDVLRVLPTEGREKYRLFAYRLHPEFWRDGTAIPVVIPEDVTPDPVPGTFRSLGFDIANHSMADVLGLECSPLSCNSVAEERPTNQWCLFPTLDAAIASAKEFSVGGAEPGDYYVVEVLEKQGWTAEQPDEASGGTPLDSIDTSD
jgi:hypothetical protein